MTHFSYFERIIKQNKEIIRLLKSINSRTKEIEFNARKHEITPEDLADIEQILMPTAPPKRGTKND